MNISKLRVVSRDERIVEYTLDGAKIQTRLKMEPRCNTGDVQKAFNAYITQKNYKYAIEYLNQKALL